MRYPYRCKCGHRWEVIKSVRQIDDAEACAECGRAGERYIDRTYFYGASDWDSAAYNPAFGKVIKNRTHLRQELQIAEREGREVIEIGNEPIDNIHKHAEKTLKEKCDRRWRQASEELGLND